MENERKNKTLRAYKIFLFILPLIILSIIIFPIVDEYRKDLGKTPPIEVLNYTQGEFAITPHSYISFQEYYSLLKPKEEDSLFLKEDYTIVKPIIKFDYKSYDYETEYYEYCDSKKVKINFTYPSYSEFKFNYSDKTLNYKIPLYYDLYYFSKNLKNQDCYFDEDKYIQGFLEDPYNNNFLDAISKDFISLKEQGYSNDEIAEIATLFVQSIIYGTDSTELNRYPYETIYEQEGNCLDKSLILAGILKNLGYKSYIITGESDSEYHAFVGIVCDEGNVNYRGEEICFIETTFFTAISSEIEIDIDEYLLTSNGTLIYTGVNYGKGLINTFELKTNEVEKIDLRLSSMESELNSIEENMCNTDCTYCNDFMIDPFYCDDAYEYNRYVKQYNKIVEEYNSLVEELYKIYYDLERLMFGNIEMLERP